MEDHPVVPAPSTRPGSGSGPSVLLIDDEPQVRQVVQRQLERLGYEVIAAVDGQAGLACLRESPRLPQVALIDLTLPDIDGVNVARAARALAPGLAVVLMSGYRSEEVTARLSGLTIAGFLQKPFSLADLRATLAEILGGG